MMGYHTAHEIPNYWKYARNFVLQDHMFEPDASWSLPAHLFLVSEWSARCTIPGVAMSCTSNIEIPALPADIGPAPHEQPDYAWTDLTYLFHKNHVSWAYYLKKGKEPDCETGEMFCKFKDQDPRTPGIWNPLPSFDTVKQDNQVKNVEPTENLFTALHKNQPARRFVGHSERRGERTSDLEHPQGSGVRHERDQFHHALEGLELDGHLPDLG